MTNDKIIKNKLGLLHLAEEPGNVSQACKILGSSRDTFYRYKELYETGGIEALREQSLQGRANFKNRVALETENRLIQLSIEYPTWGPTRMRNELLKENITLSTTGIRGIWLRHEMETCDKRLKRLEVARINFVMSPIKSLSVENDFANFSV